MSCSKKNRCCHSEAMEGTLAELNATRLKLLIVLNETSFEKIASKQFDAKNTIGFIDDVPVWLYAYRKNNMAFFVYAIWRLIDDLASEIDRIEVCNSEPVAIFKVVSWPLMIDKDHCLSLIRDEDKKNGEFMSNFNSLFDEEVDDKE